MNHGRADRRTALALVPRPAPGTIESVSFCSHCAMAPAAPPAASRVCEHCGLGLVLEAESGLAPSPDGAFVVLDGSLTVCAVSRAAEAMLATRETEAVNRHLTELLVPADAETQGAHNLAVAVTWAARGDEGYRTVTVRPANLFGVRITARIGSCGPMTAAMIVFD